MASKLSLELARYTEGNPIPDADLFRQFSANLNLANNTDPRAVTDNFNIFGQQFMAQPRLVASYIENVAVKYAATIQYSYRAQNPLHVFKRGVAPSGGAIEVLTQDIIKPRLFSGGGCGSSCENPFKQSHGRVSGKTYNWTLDLVSSVTINDTIDSQYFNCVSSFHDYIFTMIKSLVNGFVHAEYLTMKKAFSTAVENGKITLDIADDIDTLVRKMKYHSKNMRYFNSGYNSNGFIQAVPADQIVVIVPVANSVDIDIDYASQAFNPELLKDNKIKYIEIDAFPDVWRYTADHTVTTADFEAGYVDCNTFKVGDIIVEGTIASPGATDAEKTFTGANIQAVVIDRDILLCFDQLGLTITTLANPGCRYINVFGNLKQLYAFVDALSGVAIVKTAGATESGTATTQTYSASLNCVECGCCEGDYYDDGSIPTSDAEEE